VTEPAGQARASDAPAAAAGTWRLGDLTVNRLGFGAMRTTGTGGMDRGRPRDRDSSIAVIRRAVELGVDHLDTAAFYFSSLRSANELINAALAAYPRAERDDIVVATKVGPHRDPSGHWWTARPDQLRGLVEENLRQLGRDHLDVVNLRVMPAMTSLADHLGALVECRQAGLVRHLGLSNVSPEQLEEAVALTEIVCVQNRHSLGYVRPDGEAILRRCAELGIAFVPFFAIAGESREGTAVDRADEPVQLRRVATAHAATPAQVRLAWSLHQGSHVLAIPGTGDLGHLEENVAAAAIRLTDDELAALTSQGR